MCRLLFRVLERIKIQIKHCSFQEITVIKNVPGAKSFYRSFKTKIGIINISCHCQRVCECVKLSFLSGFFALNRTRVLGSQDLKAQLGSENQINPLKPTFSPLLVNILIKLTNKSNEKHKDNGRSRANRLPRHSYRSCRC